ncbi:uncharacterized protein EKO05_0001324 [Ascochyta rabiei]|uniref:Uncharacterized protein n=1 Tax=Didymella rabiei TaxID=5454 RepID=A0A162VFN9_DIDRA|nr:uncharacterized protein EKO05_0001324 [Ascochyta rabiei]KZM18430.1 hypothetical protein ST47_g10408 [Ascochyta rabiei]UPX10681.1 hypothetical protein EKO05_0001324 [Ascochyta rabiei]
MKFLSTAFSAMFLFELALAQVSGQATCYFANGTATPKTPDYLQYQACSGSAICCGLNRSNPSNGDPAKGFTKDECLPNGLCQNRVTENGVGKVSYWVDFCTNSDVSGGGCLDVCHETKNAFGNTALTPCDGTATSDRWCCGGKTDCCTSNVGVVQLAQVLGGSLSSIVSASRSSTIPSSAESFRAAATESSTSPASADASSTPSSTGAASGPNSSSSSSSGSGSKLSGGAIAGIVIGALAGVALLAAAIFFARRAAMWKKKASATPETGVVPPYTQHTNGYGSAGAYDTPTSDKYAHANQGEMYGSGLPHELPGGAMDSELPAQDSPKK